jgi:MinD-like ATPase involved in chromosome partitioning or flagellar assembly
MSAIAIAVPVSIEDTLTAQLVRHGHEVVARSDSANELSSVLSASGAVLALVAAEPRYLTDRLITESDALGVRVIALSDGDAGVQLASTLGLLEVVRSEDGWDALQAAIRGHQLSLAPVSGSSERGQVITVWGPAGSPGRTTVAINLAAELAAAGHTVALADVDTHSGSVAPTLGLLDEAPGFAAACRLAGADGLTLEQLERIGQRYLSAHGSFWVLTGIGRASRWPELSAPRVVASLRECRRWVDYTVVDSGFSLENDEEISSDLHAPRRNAATIAALREADQVIAVGAADPVGLSRFLRAHVDLMETLVTDRVTVVMNKVRAGAIGANPAAQVTNSLERFGGIIDPVLIPHDQAALDAAVLSGKTLYDTAAKSAARVAISQLAATRILPPAPAQARRRRLWLVKQPQPS